MKRALGLALGLVCAGLGCDAGIAAQTAPAESKPKVGIYDSRAVAYAHFWMPTNRQRVDDLIKTAKEARAAGETERFKELETAIKAEQDRNHLQVFSTAPVDNVLEGMKDRVEAIKKQAGITQLISKWDTQALKSFPRAQQVEVTDLLLGEFTLDARQQKVVAELRKKDPLPLKKAKELLQQGKL